MEGSGQEKTKHIPVLLNETVGALNLKPGDDAVDCTVGAGGHAAAILERTGPQGRIVGLDLDEAALESARRNLSRYGSRVMLVHANYRDIGRVLLTHAFGPVQAALLDLGFSSMEIEDPGRGFSFRLDGPLDMRYDASQDLTAAAIVNSWNQDDLAGILKEYGEERFAGRIAAAIAAARRKKRVVGTLELVDIIASAVPAGYRHGKPHFATRTFQALRIAVNDEIENLKASLPEAWKQLKPGGRLAVISFHSLEDREVKRFMANLARQGDAKLISKKPTTPTEEEIESNPRSRSAKLRVAEKIS
jgi:16S rRNA (cytosine1402-N4)-methyltransferase